MGTGYLAAIGTLIAWTISTFVLAKLSRLVESPVLNRAVLLSSTLLLGVLVCFIDGINPLTLFTLPSASNWIWLGISGILGKSVGDYCGYQAMRILGVRRRTMITTLGPGFTWLFGLMILNESMNWLGLAAMTLTLVSLLLFINSNSERNEVKQENFGKPVPGFLFGIASAGLTGLAFIISKMAFMEEGRRISEFHGTWIRIVVAFVTLMVFDIVRNKHLDFVKPFLTDMRRGSLLFFCILFGAVLGLSFSLIAIMRMNAAVAYTIFSMLPVTIMLGSVLLYNKRISLQSWVYSLIAIAGVLLLVWRNAF